MVKFKEQISNKISERREGEKVSSIMMSVKK
jgi:hypothetical protein